MQLVLPNASKLAKEKIARDIGHVLEFVDLQKSGMFTKRQVGQSLWLLKIFTAFCQTFTDDVDMMDESQLSLQTQERLARERTLLN